MANATQVPVTEAIHPNVASQSHWSETLHIKQENISQKLSHRGQIKCNWTEWLFCCRATQLQKRVIQSYRKTFLFLLHKTYFKITCFLHWNVVVVYSLCFHTQFPSACKTTVNRDTVIFCTCSMDFYCWWLLNTGAEPLGNDTQNYFFQWVF